MSAASSSTWASPSSRQSRWRSPAVLLGIGLIGVVRGFARSALGLGDVMSGVIARLKHDGANPDSANAGFDFQGVLNLLQRAVLLADALRARLRTPAVAIALARFAAPRAGVGHDRPPPAEQPELDETRSWIAYLRSDDMRRQGARAAIEGLSDREVLTYIHANLLQASAMLGETDVAAEVRALGCKALALLGDEADEVVPDDGAPDSIASDTAATRTAAHEMSDDVPDPQETTGTRPTVREVGRGPP
jgi:hypothetical protein